jgi:hypothetical protein
MTSTLIPALGLLALIGSRAPAGTIPESPPERPETTPLREVDKVPFTDGGWFAWREPAHCDGDGNLIVVPVPAADPRIPAARQKRPDAILRVSRDGKKKTTIDPTRGSFPGASEAVTVATTIDSGGSVHALLWIPGERERTFRIASYDNSGEYRSSVKIDPEEIQVGDFEAFGSGEFLLFGVAMLPKVETRLVVLDSSGNLHDVLGVAVDDPTKEPEAPKRPPQMAPGGDGSIYLVLDGEDAVYVVNPSAQIRRAFTLDATPRDWRRVGLKAAENRLAVVYYQAPANEGHGGSFWMAVYDVLSGERQAILGPVNRPPLCYSRQSDRDTFTVLGGKDLLLMAP